MQIAFANKSKSRGRKQEKDRYWLGCSKSRATGTLRSGIKRRPKREREREGHAKDNRSGRKGGKSSRFAIAATIFDSHPHRASDAAVYSSEYSRGGKVKAATRNDLNYISFSRRGDRGVRGMDRRLEIAVTWRRRTGRPRNRAGVGEREKDSVLLNYRGECRPRERVASIRLPHHLLYISFFARRRSLSLCASRRRNCGSPLIRCPQLRYLYVEDYEMIDAHNGVSVAENVVASYFPCRYFSSVRNQCLAGIVRELLSIAFDSDLDFNGREFLLRWKRKFMLTKV